MLQDERLVTYIRSLDRPLSPFLEQLRRKAQEDEVPVIRPEMQSFLELFLQLGKPRRILEIGTAVGFSALYMAEHTDPDCRITTIENYPVRIAQAKTNFAAHPMGDRIILLEGDAAEILPGLEGPYDVIFMDAAKAQYIRFLPEAKRLLSDGGILISDNVLQDGDILESHYAVERRNRTIYKRMREYLYALKHDPELVTSIVPIGDGAAVSVKGKSGAGQVRQQESAMDREDVKTS